VGDLHNELKYGTGPLRAIRLGTGMGEGDGVVRLEYAAGRAALDATRAQASELRRVADILNAPLGQVAPAAERIVAEWREQRRELEKVRAASAGSLAQRLLETAPVVGGAKVVAYWLEGDMKDLMALSKDLCADPTAFAILAARSASASVFIVSHGADVRVDAKDVLATGLQPIGVKGGGRSDFAQGSGPRDLDLDEALRRGRAEAERRLAGPGG